MPSSTKFAPEVLDPAYQVKKKVTRRQRFLNEMEVVVPWNALLEVSRPQYPTGKGGRPPFALEKMLRVYFLQQWFGLSDPGMEDALYDSESLRAFAGFRLSSDALPDESTILGFRHWLERNELTQKIFEVVGTGLTEQGLLVRKGTIVDATIIHAPSSTKNQREKPEKNAPTAAEQSSEQTEPDQTIPPTSPDQTIPPTSPDNQSTSNQCKESKRKGARDPEMSSTRKNNCWHFGMKVHVGVDSRYGLVHTIHTTTAKVHDSKVHDSQVIDKLLHGQEREIYGDKAYAKQQLKEQYQAKGVRWRVNYKAARGQTLSEHQKKSNWRRSRVRALGEHAFGLVKNTWGHRKVRYQGLKKNTAQLYSLFALANLTMARYLLCDQSGQPLLNKP